MTTFTYKRSDRKKRNKKLLKRFRRFRRRAFKPVMTSLGPGLLRAMAKTWRLTVLRPENREAAMPDGAACIQAVWHGRMLSGIPALAKENLTALVSPSDDGGLAVQVLNAFKFDVIRGSSSRGGARAMREMRDTLRSGTSIGITPDGPRGPLHRVTPGLAFLASTTGFPVLPVGYAVDRAWHLNSWDNYTIPKVGAQTVQVFGEPVWVPKGARGDELDEYAERIQRAMIDAELAGFAHLGLEPDF